MPSKKITQLMAVILLSFTIMAPFLASVSAAIGGTVSKLVEDDFSGNWNYLDLKISQTGEVYLGVANSSGPSRIMIYNKPGLSYSENLQLNKTIEISNSQSLSRLTLSDDGTRFLVHLWDNYEIRMYSRTSSTPLWSQDVVNSNVYFVKGDAALDRVVTYIYDGSDDFIVMLNGSDGTELWRLNTTENLDSYLEMTEDGSIVTYSYYVGGSNHYKMLDGLTGTQLWDINTTQWCPSSFTSDKSTIVMTDYSFDKALVISGETGQSIKNITVTDGNLDDCFVCENDQDFILPIFDYGGVHGSLARYSLDPSITAPLWEISTGYGIYSLELLKGDLILGYGVDTSNQYLYLISGDDGSILLNSSISKNTDLIYYGGSDMGYFGAATKSGRIEIFSFYPEDAEEEGDEKKAFLDQLLDSFTRDNLYAFLVVGVAGLFIGLILRGKGKK